MYVHQEHKVVRIPQHIQNQPLKWIMSDFEQIKKKKLFSWTFLFPMYISVPCVIGVHRLYDIRSLVTCKPSVVAG